MQIPQSHLSSIQRDYSNHKPQISRAGQTLTATISGSWKEDAVAVLSCHPVTAVTALSGTGAEVSRTAVLIGHEKDVWDKQPYLQSA